MKPRKVARLEGSRVVCLVLIGCFALSGGLASAQDETLKTIGALGASNLYMTYIAVGAVADGDEHDGYDDESAEKLLSSISRFNAKVNEALQTLLDAEVLTEHDGQFILEMIGTLTLLSGQADSYLQYMQTSGKEHAESYSRHREEAWAKIQMLLGAK